MALIRPAIWLLSILQYGSHPSWNKALIHPTIFFLFILKYGFYPSYNMSHAYPFLNMILIHLEIRLLSILQYGSFPSWHMLALIPQQYGKPARANHTSRRSFRFHYYTKCCDKKTKHVILKAGINPWITFEVKEWEE